MCFVTYFFNIVCCLTLNVNLQNNVKEKWGDFEGVYTFQGFSNEMDHWVDAEEEHAIWYIALGTYHWIIGSLVNLGSSTAAI